ncbi:MAG: hypothetical protein J6B98_04365 [Bacilli bacterium]|nr:hypothetical protein [Bacilli bacterium]
MKKLTLKQLRKKFKKMYLEEFEDSNESFMDFMLDLISEEVLIKVIGKGEDYYSSLFYKYK